MADLSGKRALVTGGSRGIGAAIAKRLAADGADVAVGYGGQAEAAEQTVRAITAAGRRGFAFQADMADPEAAAGLVRQAAEALGGLDILVHNAGVAKFGHVGEDTVENYARQYAVNVGGVFAGTVAAAPLLSNGGRILIIGSINAHWMGMQGGAVYGSTKAAVAQMARGWARDLGGRRITVNVIQPGPVDTDMNPADGPIAQVLLPYSALGRYGRPEEIAALAAFLASDEAAFITGSAIDIDSGVGI